MLIVERSHVEKYCFSFPRAPQDHSFKDSDLRRVKALEMNSLTYDLKKVFMKKIVHWYLQCTYVCNIVYFQLSTFMRFTYTKLWILEALFKYGQEIAMVVGSVFGTGNPIKLVISQDNSVLQLNRHHFMSANFEFILRVLIYLIMQQ